MKTRIQFLLSLFLVLLMYGNKTFSQNDRTNTAPKTIPGSFIIHGELSKDDIVFYTNSIETADFEQYRLKDVAVELEFKNGFKLELLSARDLTIKNKNQSVNPNTYPIKANQPSFQYPVFEILKSGWITGEAKPTSGTKK